MSVVPAAWLESGVPPEAVAAFAGGSCPVHLVPMVDGKFEVGGKGAGWYATVHEVPGGWCAICKSWWSRPYGPVLGGVSRSGLAATFDVRDQVEG